MKKCFFNDCKKEVNERGKFCEYHDKKEIDANKELCAIFDRVEKKECEGYSV